MKLAPLNRRAFIKSSTAAVGIVLSPAIIGRAEAATLKLKCSSSLPNDPKYANGRVYYDNLVKHIKGNGLGEQIDVTFFPDNQLGQEIDAVARSSWRIVSSIPCRPARPPWASWAV
mgnify:CR=1 FL=1